MNNLRTETTRYLCAAAHLDSGFQEKIFKLIVEEEHRAICPALGVDLVSVINHCLAANHRKRIRDFGLSLIYVLGIALSFVFGDWTLFLISWPLFWIVIFAEMWDSHSLVVHNLMKSNFNPDCVPARISEDLKSDLQLLQDKSNVSIYSGFSPFVGSGIELGGWSFSLNVDKGKEEFGKRLEPLPFEVQELYDEVSRAIEKLGFDDLSVEDRLFVNGKDIREDKRFLGDILSRPVTTVDQDLLQSFVGNPTHVIRHYKCIRIPDWKGELVLSIFLRFSKTGGSFFSETSYFLLTPIAEPYRKADNLNLTLTAGKFSEFAVLSTIISTFVLFFGWLLVLGRITQYLFQWYERSKVDKHIRDTPNFDYGATASMREHVSSWEYRRYFQKLDKEMYLKTLERQILETVIEFFEAKRVDTSALKERQTTILNSGVIVTGGEVKAHSFAVGEHSKAVGLVKAVATAAGRSTN